MYDNEAEARDLRVLPADRMSKFQVAFVAASFGEADMLSVYIDQYLCDRKYYTRDWREQCKASSFLT